MRNLYTSVLQCIPSVASQIIAVHVEGCGALPWYAETCLVCIQGLTITYMLHTLAVHGQECNALPGMHEYA